MFTVTTKFGFTIIVKVVAKAHCPVFGVNVYVVVAVLSKAGDQVPVIPLLEVVGSADNVSPIQIGSTEVNVGTIVGVLTTIVIETAPTQIPALGVNV